MRIPRRGKAAGTRRAIRTPMQGTSIERTISQKTYSMERWIKRFQSSAPEHLTMHQINKFLQFVQNTKGYLQENWKAILKIQEDAGGGPARDTLSALTNIMQAYDDSPDLFLNDLMKQGDGSVLYIAHQALQRLHAVLNNSSM